MSKYKVGDRVKVRNDIKRLESYHGVSVTGGMAKMAGETFTVASAHYEEGWYYRLAETGCIWTDEMFEGLADGPMLHKFEIVFPQEKKREIVKSITDALLKTFGASADDSPDDSPDDTATARCEEPDERDNATPADTLNNIANILQDYVDSGRLTEFDALIEINKRLTEHFVGYGAEPPELVRSLPDDANCSIYTAVTEDPKVTLHKQITAELSRIYEAKNHDYGDSFGETYRKLGLISAVTRISDKVNRLQSLCTKEQRVADESIRDTLLDCANYCIMTLIALEGTE